MEKKILPYLFLYAFTIISTYFHIEYINNNTNIFDFDNLPDLIVDNLPDLSKSKFFHKIVDYSLFAWCMPILINSQFKELSIFVFKMFSIILFLRTLTKSFTILPSQDNNCKNDSKDPFCYLNGYCNDKIFSGHTSISLLVILTAIDNKIIDGYNIPLVIILHILYALLILASRNHYSVDVILSYIITTSIFYNLKNII